MRTPRGLTPRRQPSAVRLSAGFALLEAVFALVLLAAALIPLYMLIGGASQSAFRLERNNRLAEIELNALDLMSAVNPMERPEGVVDLGPYVVRWTSKPVLDPVDGSSYPSGRGFFRISLYQAAVEVVDPSGDVVISFPLRMVGFRRIAGNVVERR